MSYILGSIIVLMAAYIASIQGEIKHYKTRIKSLNSRIGELLRENLRGQEDNEKLSQEVQDKIAEKKFYSDIADWLVGKLEAVPLSDEQLKRWGQLVTDCKKPFERKKVPINVGGKFTRSVIIAVDDIVNVVNAIRNHDNTPAQ